MSEIYNGSSDGFGILADGYCDYGRAVIAGRSFPDIRDGLKPVGRRCVYMTSLIPNIDRLYVKSGTIVGQIFKIHPHGDGAIYNAFALMTDSNGTFNVPPFAGTGNWSKAYYKAGPAAMRYTKAKLSQYAQDYLGNMPVCDMRDSEEGDGKEPVVFATRYPTALTNGTSGMAVSVSTVIPSFNFHDVVDLTIERLEKGFCTSIITPDFPTGGILVKDDKELMKIMQTGKGKIKIRAKVEIQGKEIHVLEVPYGNSVESILDSIDRADIKDIASAKKYEGNNSDTVVKITCKSKKVVEQVLLQLYKLRILQSSLASSMIFVESEVPVITGAYGVVEKWLDYAKKKSKEGLEYSVDSINTKLSRLSYFIRLISNEEWRDSYVDIVVHKNLNSGKDYLRTIFEDIPDDVVAWIADRKLHVFNNGGKYKEDYVGLEKDRDTLMYHINNIESYILADLKSLKAERKGQLKRKTEVTNLDYRFSKITNDEIEDSSVCVYTLYNSGFLKKTRTKSDVSKEGIITQINALANSTLIGFDCFGRLLRVYGNDIKYTQEGEHGEYLPRYFEAEGFDGYKIPYMSLLDNKKRMLIYKDGFIGFLDTSEFEGKKHIKTVQNGVDRNVYNALVEVLHEDDFPEYLVVADESTGNVRFGVTCVNDIREASRKSRAKVFGGNNVDIRYVGSFTYMDLLQFMEEPFNYVNRMKNIGSRKVYGDTDTLMKEGRYYEEV